MEKIKEAIEILPIFAREYGGQDDDVHRATKTALAALKTIEYYTQKRIVNYHITKKNIKAKFNSFKEVRNG